MGINRRDLIKLAATQTAAIACSLTSSPELALVEAKRRPSIILKNSQFELTLRNGPGIQAKLVHLPTGMVLAEGPYYYSVSGIVFEQAARSSDSVEFHGSTACGLEVHHRFTLDPAGSWLEEAIEFSNRSALPMDLHDARAGFILPIALDNGKVPSPWSNFNFTAIPFRREPGANRRQYADFSVDQVLSSQYFSELWSDMTTVTSAYASEGWALTDGRQGFLISKFSPVGLEHAILDRIVLQENTVGLRWGGIGIYRGNPERGAWLLPGATHTFGVSRLTPFAGDWLEGYYTFRDEMEKRGMSCPKGFNPPIHWDELYDNKLWHLPGNAQNNPEMRKKYYSLEDMKEEAAKAKDIGCEALYLDPGWDTNFGSKIWDEARLTPYRSFVSMLSSDYGLKSSLHTPLSGWCDPSSYPADAYRLDRFGERAKWNYSGNFYQPMLCGASTQYVDETYRRLKTLAEDGAAFFMFDGTQYHEECWDLGHGHQVPSGIEEHCQATFRLARMVHAAFPDVLIEMHDPVAAGVSYRVTPIYYGYGPCPEGEGVYKARGFDTVWAFELMWDPMKDLLSGRSIALYYYNLAYSVPLYLMIDLRTDNKNALVFWWNASTCRHLGIGGTHPDETVREAQRESMVNYRRLKPYFTSGTFYGIDEQTHVHTDRAGKSAVLNCFNLEAVDVKREIHFDPARLGLARGGNFRFLGDADFQLSGNTYVGQLNIPGYGHTLIEVN